MKKYIIDEMEFYTINPKRKGGSLLRNLMGMSLIVVGVILLAYALAK